MITHIHFETLASGMKAKLDPTYRQVHRIREVPGKTEILKKPDRESRDPLLPFTTKRKI